MTLLSAPSTLSPSSENTATGSLSYGAIKDFTQPEQEQTQSSRLLELAIDLAYTVNHSVICTATDPLTDIPISAVTPKLINGIKRRLGREVKPYEEPDPTLLSLLVGEVTGDWGAVPVVVGLQHFAPKFMEGIGKLARPIAKPLFQRSALRTLRAELKLSGLDIEKSPEFEHRARAIFQGTTNELPESIARIKEVYEREMEDLPKAIMWTVASPAINLTMQKKVMKSEVPISYLLVGKALGSIVTSSLTVGMRSLSPSHAQRWDDFIAEKAGKPATTAVAKLFGLDAEAVQAGVEKKAGHHKKNGAKWTERTAEPSQPRFAKVSTEELTQRANKEAMGQLQRTAMGEHSSKVLQRNESPSPSPAGSR